MRPSLSVLIVVFNSRQELPKTLRALAAELRADDEVIVVDNASEDGTGEYVRAEAPTARLITMGRNVGFPAACNAGAVQASGDLLVILNPDAAPRPGWGEAIRRPWLEGRGWAAWQALIAEAGGSEINSAGNPVHFTGIAWAGRHGRPISEAPPASEVVSMSGACMAIPLRTWLQIGGFEERFFLYHEDVDLSLRLRLRGDALGIEPTAVVDHEYEFGAREHKWRWLERNRLAILIRVYPARLLLLLLPGLLATELVLFVVSGARGWSGQKFAGNLEALRWLPRLLLERRRIQRARGVGSAEFASWLTPDLDSPFIPAPARSLPARILLRGYWRLVTALLGSR